METKSKNWGTDMTLDAQSEIARLRGVEMGLSPLHSISPIEARYREFAEIRNWGPPMHEVRDCLISGASGRLTGRIYTPNELDSLPVVVWFHGGGWVQGGILQTDSVARKIAQASGCIVVSVGYRLAPETKFPYPVEDCYAATRWVTQNREVLGSKNGQIAVAGYSAGGNLAAAVSIMASDRLEFELDAQVLLCPVLDKNFTLSSYLEYGQGYGLTIESMQWYWNHYLSDMDQALDPYAVPMQCKDFSNLPEALIITADHDPLCDEGEIYATKLTAAGVRVTLSQYLGVMHGFISMSDSIDQGMCALEETGNFLKGRFLHDTP